MNIPSLFDVNVTASSTISIGVVRHRIYLTSSLKISENAQKSRMNLRLFQAQKTMKIRTQSLKGTSKSFYSFTVGLLVLRAKKLNIVTAWKKTWIPACPLKKQIFNFACLKQVLVYIFPIYMIYLGPCPFGKRKWKAQSRKIYLYWTTGQYFFRALKSNILYLV